MRYLAALLVTALSVSSLPAETVPVFQGEIKLETPEGWKSVQPKSRIVEKEYQVKKDADSEQSARVTMMGAGGSIEANIARWAGQFKGAGGKGVEKKVEEMEMGENKVHLVELSGTYAESVGGGPFFGGKKVMRENYKMLGAIIANKEGRQFFIKMTGPKDIVDASKKGFKKMLGAE